jgi:hypothetical protein
MHEIVVPKTSSFANSLVESLTKFFGFSLNHGNALNSLSVDATNTRPAKIFLSPIETPKG